MAFGVSQYSCPNNVIDFNTISANTRIGVRFGPGSDNCQLHDNTISNNGLAPASSALAQEFPACGVIIVSAQDVHIWNNTFTGNPANVVGNYTTSPVAQPATPSTQPVSTQPVSTQPVSTKQVETKVGSVTSGICRRGRAFSCRCPEHLCAPRYRGRVLHLGKEIGVRSSQKKYRTR